MPSSKSSQNQARTIAMITSWCLFLRQDMNLLFQKDMSTFIEAIPKILVDEAESLPPHRQQVYFDIITLLQSNRDKLSEPIRAAISNNLDKFVDYAKESEKSATDDNTTSDSLSLIDTEEIEVGIVLEGQAGKIAAKIPETINDSYFRISKLIPKIQTSSQLPCHPKALIQCMLDSLAFMSLQTQHKILLVKQFAQFISVDELQKIIAKSLENAKIPEFSKQILKQSSSSTKDHRQKKNVQQQRDSASYSGELANENKSSNSKNNTDKSRKNFKSKPTGIDDSDDLLASSTARYHSQHKQDKPNTFFNPSHISSTQEGDSTVSEQSDNPVSKTSAMAEVFDHSYIAQSNATRSTELLNQLGHLRQLRTQMASVPIAPEPKNPLVTEEVMSAEQIDSILVDMQLQQPIQPVHGAQDIQTVAEIRTMLREQLVSDESTVQKIDDKESDIINLISMLFNEILDNPNLSTEIKALLARLQIPMLRVALMTPDFITQDSHPFRKLLDKLAEAGISWDKSNKDSKFFDKLEHFVFRILKEFKSDQSIFNTVYQELLDFLDTESSKSTKIEQRTLEKEKKKAESQLAKSEVQKQLNQRLIGKKIPFCVIKLIQNGWWQVLYHTNIRYGIDSEQWKNGLKIVDALIWSVSPPTKQDKDKNLTEWLEQLDKIQKKLINNINVGLNHINFDSVEQKNLISEIAQIHTDLLAEKDIVALEVKDSDKKIDLDDRYQIQESIEEEINSVELPTDAITSAQKSQESEVIESSEELMHMLNAVNKLNTGDWVEFDSDTAEPKRRKLVAKVRTLNKLIFTNRRGIKVAEITNTKLAQMMLNTQAKILTLEEHIIDKALFSVFENIDKIETVTE